MRGHISHSRTSRQGIQKGNRARRLLGEKGFGEGIYVSRWCPQQSGGAASSSRSIIAPEFVYQRLADGACNFTGYAKQEVSKWLKICLFGLCFKQLSDKNLSLDSNLDFELMSQLAMKKKTTERPIYRAIFIHLYNKAVTKTKRRHK